AVNAAETCVFEFGHLAAAGDGRFSLRLQGTVHHALHDDRPGGVVGTGLGAEPQEFTAQRVDVVLLYEPHYRRRRQRIDAVVRTAYAKAAPDDLADFRPVVARPFAPVVEPHAIGRHISG